MAVIGTMAVNIVATTDKFIKGLHNGRGMLARFSKSISAVNGLVGGFAATLAGAFTISSLKSSISAMDELGDAAERMGAPIKEFSKLTGAGKLLGIDEGAFIGALDRMQKAVGDSSKAFKEIGLSVEQLKTMSADKMFMEIAAAIERLPTPAERAAAASSIFGKSMGPEFLELINKGAAGIGKLADEADRAGLAINQSAANAIENADRAIKKLEATWEGFKRKLAVEAANLLPGGSDNAWRNVVNSLSKKDFARIQTAVSESDQMYLYHNRQKRLAQEGIRVPNARSESEFRKAVQDRQLEEQKKTNELLKEQAKKPGVTLNVAGVR